MEDSIEPKPDVRQSETLSAKVDALKVRIAALVEDNRKLNEKADQDVITIAGLTERLAHVTDFDRRLAELKHRESIANLIERESQKRADLACRILETISRGRGDQSVSTPGDAIDQVVVAAVALLNACKDEFVGDETNGLADNVAVMSGADGIDESSIRFGHLRDLERALDLIGRTTNPG